MFGSLFSVGLVWLSSMKGHLASKVIFHQMLSSTEGCLPPKAVLHQRLSSIKGPLPSIVVFHQNLPPSKVVFHQRTPSTKGYLPLYIRWCSSGKIRIHFIPFHTFPVVGLLVSAYSVKLNWAQPELSKNIESLACG